MFGVSIWSALFSNEDKRYNSGHDWLDEKRRLN